MFALSEEHQAIREAVRAVCDAKVAPHAAEVDETGQFPQTAYDALAGADFARPAHPGRSTAAPARTRWPPCIVIEEVARACASASLIPAVNKLGTLPLILAGSEELKKKYLTPVAAGEAMFSYCLSEPEAGSDAAAMKTRAVRDGDDWVLNGVKRWITNAGQSRVLHGVRRDRPREGRSRHLGVRGREGRRGGLLRCAGEEARHQGLADPRGLLRQRPDPRRPDDRGGGHRLRHRDARRSTTPG